MKVNKLKEGSIFLLVTLSLLLIATGCAKTSEETLKKGTIIQLVSHQDSLQENAIYDFNQGKLTVSMRYSPFQSPEVNPNDSAYQEIVEKDMKRLKTEFPKEKIDFETLSNQFEKTFKSVKLIKDTEKKEIWLKSSDINKKFKLSETNDKRLIDEVGIEYELVEE